MNQRSGGCLCGAVRFTLTGEPLSARICWCRDCQHLSANGSVNVLVPEDTLSIRGTLAEYTKSADSGNRVTREFCPSCGTHLFARSAARPHLRVLRAGNLDEPASIRPQLNIWTASAPAWACMDPALSGVPHQPAPPPESS
ncbi:MAG: GFA family protein [Pseudomonadota bacterium]|nr:GFA family protein [Pseudomonadota bacterium]